MLRHRTVPAVAALLVLLGASAPALAGDIFQLKDGRFSPPVQGSSPSAADFQKSNFSFVDANDQGVSYRMAGVPQLQNYKSADVEELHVDPSSLPQAWRDAEAELQGGSYESAMQKFLAIGGDRGAGSIVKQKAFRMAVQAAAGTGNVASMRSAVAAMDSAFPQSFYRRHAREIMLQAFTDAGDSDSALAMATELEGMPGLGESDKLKISLLRTRVAFRGAGKDKAALKKAQEEFQRIATATTGRPNLASANMTARLGAAQAGLALGDSGAAKTEFDWLVKNAKEPGVLGAAYNGLGEIWYAQGDRAGWIEARRCFLRVTCMYADGTSGEDQAKALYHTGACFFRLQDTPNWWADGVKELVECQQRFPKSHWGQQAVLLRQQTPKPK